MFRFLDYTFDQSNFLATFRYQGVDNVIFAEKIHFIKTDFAFNNPTTANLLNRALELAHLVLGVSYYKTHPTTEVALPYKLDTFKADFFDHIYQEGLSQYAYENNLTRDNLTHFVAAGDQDIAPLSYDGQGILCGQSGGKDSLLVASLLNRADLPWTGAMITSSPVYPQVLDHTKAKDLQIIIRRIDKENLLASGGYSGHVPVTYINMAIMLIQAILNGDNYILTAIGHEGAEPHAMIGDLPVNHQWSKTWEAEQLFQNYVWRYLAANIYIGSPIRQFSELKIAELFVKNCWSTFGHDFSSCNVANYKQGANNQQLSWCGLCAKCANSYLLFAPFLEPEELNLLFPEHRSLLEKPELFDDFKGLLGVDNTMKPFECVGEVDELRYAYHHKKPGTPDLPFTVPSSSFDYNKTYPANHELTKLLAGAI